MTILRLLVLLFRQDEARGVVNTVWPLVAEDRDLKAQRFFLDWAATHSLPGDPMGCRARLLGATQTPSPKRDITGAGLAADRVHALSCEYKDDDHEAEAAAIAAVRNHAPQLNRPLGVVLAYRRWAVARRMLNRQANESIPVLIDAVTRLARAGNTDLAMLALDSLSGVVRSVSPDVFASIVNDRVMLSELVRMIDTVFIGLPQAGWRMVVECLSKLVAGWAVLGSIQPDWDVHALTAVLTTMQLLKGRALAGALTQPGSAAPDPEIARAFASLAELDADPNEAPDDRPLQETIFGDIETVLNSYLHSAEREPGSTLTERRANMRRQTQAIDTARLMATAGAAPPYALTDYARALSDHAVLLSVCVGEVGADSMRGFHAMLVGRGVLRLVAVYDPGKSGPWEIEFGRDRNELGVGTRIFSDLGVEVASLRRELLEDPLHRDVTRAGERKLVEAAAYLSDGVLEPLAQYADIHDRPRLVFWPHESLYFSARPLIGDDATPAAALDALGSSQYLHLAAHGVQDVDAPLFARLFLAGGALHAYEILERDLRAIELVTLSACESALLRYDFLDNLHGLAAAFLRAGTRAVIGALWPVGPEVAMTFFTELYAHLAAGGTRVEAFRFAQSHARARHPNYRDWGAFTYFGS